MCLPVCRSVRRSVSRSVARSVRRPVGSVRSNRSRRSVRSRQSGGRSGRQHGDGSTGRDWAMVHRGFGELLEKALLGLSLSCVVMFACAIILPDATLICSVFTHTNTPCPVDLPAPSNQTRQTLHRFWGSPLAKGEHRNNDRR